MSFLNKIFNNSPKTNTLELCWQLQNHISDIPVSKEYEKIIADIDKECTISGAQYPERQQQLLKLISLLEEYDNNDKRYLVAWAYSWSKVKYNQKAIDAMNTYIEEGLSERAINNYHGVREDKRKFEHLVWIYQTLGEEYIKNNEYEKAMECFDKELENSIKCGFIYGWHLPYLHIADVYRRMNKLDLAIKTLDDAKPPKEIYFTDDSFLVNSKEEIVERENRMSYETLNKFKNDYIEKKQRGYVFRPKKEKNSINTED